MFRQLWEAHLQTSSFISAVMKAELLSGEMYLIQEKRLSVILKKKLNARLMKNLLKSE